MIIIVDNSKKGSKNNGDLVNDAVRFPQVRLIGPDGEQLGIMSSREAQLKANALELDLLCVAPGANPPVCRILNYSKYKFEQQKKAKEAKKNQHTVEIKEIQLTPQIGQHDLETKARAARKFFTSSVFSAASSGVSALLTCTSSGGVIMFSSPITILLS